MDNLFNGVRRCGAAPSALTQRPIRPPADYSHVPLSPLRCLKARPLDRRRRGVDGQPLRLRCGRHRHRRRPCRLPQRSTTRGAPLGRPAAPVSPREPDLDPNPNLLFTYATAVLAQPHTNSRTTEPGPFASQSQPYASPSGRCRRADGAAAARAGGHRGRGWGSDGRRRRRRRRGWRRRRRRWAWRRRRRRRRQSAAAHEARCGQYVHVGGCKGGRVRGSRVNAHLRTSRCPAGRSRPNHPRVAGDERHGECPRHHRD